MSKRAITMLSAAVAVTAVAGACTLDSSLLSPRKASADSSASASAAGSGAASILRPVHPLQRIRDVEQDESWSFVIGPMGGSAHDRATGLTLTFAPGAVPARVRITVTALAGHDVAYRFEPHGLRFSAPVTLAQSLHDTRPWNADTSRLPLSGAYFPGARPQTDGVVGGILASEVLPASTDPSGVVRFRIHHFSGYTVASAEADSVQGEGGR